MEGKNGENRQNNLKAYEQIRTTQVPKDIICKNCMFQLPPVIWDGKELERYTNSNCLVYDDEPKPHGVLWEHGECQMYTPE